MRLEVVQEPLTIPPDMVLTLEDRQAEPRKVYLKRLQGKKYRVLAPVQFKVGEVIGLSGRVSKDMLVNIKPLEGEKK